jgi:hypothetical protein
MKTTTRKRFTAESIPSRIPGFSRQWIVRDNETGRTELECEDRYHAQSTARMFNDDERS